MSYRNGNYIAFDGQGQANPTKSDFRYYATLQAWTSGKNIEFKFVNSHDKTAAVRDSSLKSTLEGRIRERLASSKNVVVLLSTDTRRSGSMLSYEIEKAVDLYNLPLICSYVQYSQVMDPLKLRALWPLSLEERINDGRARAIHIPFKKDAILDAMTGFTVHNHSLTHGLHFYSLDAHRQFGCI